MLDMLKSFDMMYDRTNFIVQILPYLSWSSPGCVDPKSFVEIKTNTFFKFRLEPMQDNRISHFSTFLFITSGVCPKNPSWLYQWYFSGSLRGPSSRDNEHDSQICGLSMPSSLNQPMSLEKIIITTHQCVWLLSTRIQ